MSVETLEQASRVIISPDGVRAVLRIAPNLENEIVTTDLIEAVLSGQGIDAQRMLKPAIASLVEQLRTKPGEEAEAVAAEGVAPTNGADGWFERSPELASPEPPAAGPEDSAVDFYAHTSIVVVRSGQVLGVLHEPTEAADGLDVYGTPIKASQGQAAALRLDDSVELREDGSVVSLFDGCLDVSEGQLSVRATLQIDESVDFSTGNVDFPGNVTIGGGVCDKFKVCVGGDLEVLELVEAARIEVTGSATLHRGIAGRGKGSLSVAVDLEAGYVDGARLYVGRDLVVRKEISNCTTIVGRFVQSPECSVVGGEMSFRFGGNVRTLGSEAETELLVRIGCDPEMDARAKLLDGALRDIAGRMEKIRAKLAEASPADANRLNAELARLESRGPSIRSALERLIDAYGRMAGAVLRVERSIMPGVTLAIGPQAATVRQGLSGPVEILVDESGTMVFRTPGSKTMTPLAGKAVMHVDRDAVHLDDLQRWLESSLLGSSENAA
ncbi:hypothetical protein AY599_06315 [Leptolyngbya valderiana BDU 20041]|nr:hypothetical protein AY599_06315 [Leptolyngbya valderiana BDU 20041]